MYNKKLVFTAACSGMLIFGIVMVSLGTINLYLSDKFSLDEIAIASLAALLPFGILSGSLVFGPIVDRYSYKAVLVICSIMIIIALEVIAYTSTFSYIQAAFFLIGFGGGVINGGTNALVADISEGEKSSKLSLLGVFFGVGALGFPLITRLFSKSYSYEIIIASIGIIIFIPILFFSIIKFPLPKQAQGFPIRNAFKLTKDLTLIMLSMVLFFQSGLEGITNNWITRYLQSTGELSSDIALTALTVLALSLTVTRLFLGWILKKISSKWILYLSMLFVISGGVVLLAPENPSLAITGMILLGIGFAASFPVLLGYISEIYSSLSGTAFSIALFIALIGNTIINYMVGVIAQESGMQSFPYIIMGIALLYISTLSIGLKRVSHKIKI
jgi:MFS transporter, FHS family, glucose/mannose:H+ symporter